MTVFAVAVGWEGAFAASRLEELPDFPERRLFLIPAADLEAAREWAAQARSAAVLVPFPERGEGA